MIHFLMIKYCGINSAVSEFSGCIVEALADEALDDPPDCLQKETQRQGIGEKTFSAGKIGSFIPFSAG